MKKSNPIQPRSLISLAGLVSALLAPAAFAASFQGLGYLPGGADSIAIAVSADGSAVVGDSESTPIREAFRWTQATGMVGLGYLPGGYFASQATGVSADGSVVVGVSESASGWEAFLWTQADGMRSLADLLGNDLGIDLTGWILTEATGISADGTVIVGVGYHNGNTEAWIADLSSAPVSSVPATPALLAAGALAGWSRRARRA